METGKFVQWDYVNNQPYLSYTRAWPYTFCVAAAFYVFGESLLVARMVSVMFGVLFWLILFRCLKLELDDDKIAFLISILMAVNPTLIEIFRTIRMYAMALPLSLLLIIFVYKFLESAELIRNDARLLKKVYPYSVKDTIALLVLIILNYLVMPNALVIAGGVALWILYKGIAEKKRQYHVSIFVIIGILALAIVSVLLKNEMPEVIQNVISRVQYHIAGENSVQIEYLWAHMKYPVGYTMGCCAFIIALCNLIREKAGKKKNVLLFLMFIELTTIAFFTIFTNRGFAIRYIFFLIPISCLLILYSLYLLFRRDNRFGKQLYTFVMLLCVVQSFICNFGKMYRGENNYSKFSEAYEKISEIIDSDAINLCTSHYRSNYLAQYFNEVNYLEYTQEKYLEKLDNDLYKKTDVEQLIDYSDVYRDGVLAIESAKFNYTTESMRLIAEGYMDKITGTGLDDTNLESYLYNLYHKEISYKQLELDRMIYSRNQIIAYNVDKVHSKMYILVDVDKLPEKSHLLCINTGCGDNENMEYKSYQLVIDKNQTGSVVYCVDWKFDNEKQFFIDPTAGDYTYKQSFEEIQL